MFQETLEFKYKFLMAELALRPRLEEMERKTFPPWLITSNYPRRIKWSLVLNFKLTDYAQIIRKRLDEANLSIEKVAHSIENIYGDSSATSSLKRSMPPFDGEDWDLLFDKLKIFHLTDKAALKLVPNPLTIKEESDIKRSPKKSGISNFILYARYLPLNFKGEGAITQIERQIKEVLNFINYNFFIIINGFFKEMIFFSGAICSLRIPHSFIFRSLTTKSIFTKRIIRVNFSCCHLSCRLPMWPW